MLGAVTYTNNSSDDLDAPSWFFEEGESPPSSQKPSQSKFCAAGSVSKGEKIILHVDMVCNSTPASGNNINITITNALWQC